MILSNDLDLSIHLFYFCWRSDSNVFRSFTITKDKIGPNLVPWGTPAFTWAHSEIDFPSLTFCLRLDKNSHNHGIRDLRSPMSISNQYVQVNSVECLTKI